MEFRREATARAAQGAKIEILRAGLRGVDEASADTAQKLRRERSVGRYEEAVRIPFGSWDAAS